MWPEDLLSCSSRFPPLRCGWFHLKTDKMPEWVSMRDMLEGTLFYPASHSDEAGSIVLGAHWTVQSNHHSEYPGNSDSHQLSSAHQHSQQDAHQKNLPWFHP